MKKAGILLFGLCFILFTSFISAINIEKTVVNDVIITDFNQPAKFILQISEATPGSYNFYTLTDVKLLPSSPFDIHSGTNSVEVYVYPTDSLNVHGLYTFTYDLKKLDGATYEDKLTIRVASLEEAIEISSDEIDFNSNEITFYVRNLEKADLKGIKVHFTSVFFDENVEFDLTPYEKHEITIKVDRDKMKTIKAGVYLVTGEFQTDNGIKKLEGKLYLGEKKGITSTKDSSGFIVRSTTISKINVGNVQEIVDIEVTKDIITRLLTSFSKDPTYVQRKGFFVEYRWTEILNPAEILTVKVKTSYVFPLIVLIIAAVLILLFRRFSEGQVDVRKSVSYIKTKGGEFALRVNLYVSSKDNIENVTLMDRIPGIVKIYNKFAGTIVPSKIDHNDRRIQWDIGSLRAGEERMFSYIVYSKVSVVGKFSLPAALLIFEKEGRVHEAESNNVFFMAEQAKS